MDLIGKETREWASAEVDKILKRLGELHLGDLITKAPPLMEELTKILCRINAPASEGGGSDGA